MHRRLTLIAVALAVAATMLPAGATTTVGCNDTSTGALPLSITVDGETADGLYALPDAPPTALVVFAHGYGHTVESWRAHLERTAANDGVIAVAMNYRGTTILPATEPGGLPESRGWRVAEGAEDSIAAAQLFEAACSTIETIVMYGVSMGGNASGLAVAAGATRTGGAPLFDYWIVIEGATNVSETYQEARLVAQSGNAFAANAQQDIEEEMGGTFEEVPEVYLERTVVTRADDIAASGLRGVLLVHGVDDGLVPYNQSREMAAALHASGVAAELYTVLTREDGTEPGTTLTGTVLGPTGQYESPFAGHASEASTTHTVGTTGFALLSRLLGGEPVQCGEFVLDGKTGASLGAQLSVDGTVPLCPTG